MYKLQVKHNFGVSYFWHTVAEYTNKSAAIKAGKAQPTNNWRIVKI